jgi:hypothetical protein
MNPAGGVMTPVVVTPVVVTVVADSVAGRRRELAHVLGLLGGTGELRGRGNRRHGGLRSRSDAED